MHSSPTCNRSASRGPAAEGRVTVHLDFELLSGVVTIVWFVAFIALWLWAWSRRRRAVYEAAARMPLDQDGSG